MIFTVMAQLGQSQTIIKMKKNQDNLIMPCKVNGAIVSTSIDLDEPTTTISLRELLYLLNDDKMYREDIIGNKDSPDSFFVTLREVDFAGFTLHDIKARVLKDPDVPLSLGKNDIGQLGNFNIANGTIIIDTGKASFDYSLFKEVRQYTNQHVSNAFSVTEPVVNVTITDKNKKPATNLMIVFTGEKKGTVYQEIIDNSGSAGLQLPDGDSYTVALLGYDSYNRVATVLDIPALKKANSRYTQPFLVAIQYDAPEDLDLTNYFFDKNKYDIQNKQYKNLDSLVEYLLRQLNFKIELNGYTDSTETGQPELSLNRARIIKNYLVSKNIDSARITIVGHSFSGTIKGATPDLYRRTEVKLSDPFSQETYSAPVVKSDSVVSYLDNNDKNNFASSGKLDASGKRQGAWHEYEVKNENLFRKRDNDDPTKYDVKYLLYQEGNYVDNVKTGIWNTYFIEENTLLKVLIKKAAFVNGKENGAFQYFYEDGNIAQTGTYVNGNIEDSSTIFFEDHKVFGRLMFKDNERNGEQKYYFHNGTLSLSINFKNGLKDGEEKAYYQNGIMSESCHYIADEWDGPFRYYYPNGNIWTERVYDKGLFKKLTILVDKNGKPLDGGSFKNGNGVLHLYTEYGKVYLSITYKDGKEIGEE